jgi:hypothetical protein
MAILVLVGLNNPIEDNPKPKVKKILGVKVDREMI